MCLWHLAGYRFRWGFKARAQAWIRRAHQHWWRCIRQRNQCEAAHIKAVDEDRRACEEAIAGAEHALEVARIEEALAFLGSADAAMERLRRRI